MLSPSLELLIALGCLSLACNATAINKSDLPSRLAVDSETAIQISAVSSNDAIGPIDVNFPGFAFEQGSLITYLGPAGKPNHFSLNLIDNIVSRTGGIPIIRVGGTSGDNATFDPAQKEQIKGYKESTPIKDQRLVIGPSYFESCKLVPYARYIVQVPLRKQNVANTVEFTKSAVHTIGLSNIDTIEIGNEPSAYPVTVGEYVPRFLEMETAITKRVFAGDEPKLYQGIDGASTANVQSFNPVTAWTDGLDSNNGIKQIAEHFYQTGPATTEMDVASLLMNHTAIKGRLDVYKPLLQYLKKNAPSVSLIMDEVGNSLTANKNGRVSPVLEFQAVLGSALWAVDFQLYMMSIGFARVNMQQHDTSGYNLWIPQAILGYYTKPIVQAPYYAQPFIADFISTGGNTYVSYINLNSDVHSAYAAYEDNKLVRLAIVNFEYWSEKGTREAQKFSIRVSDACSGAKVEYLTAPEGALSKSSLTWAGMQWSYENQKGTLVSQDTENMAINSGLVHVHIPASSAAIIHLQN